MSEQTPGDASSAFKARLDALRSKGPPPAAPAPSLKERLQQGAPVAPSSPEDLKARIQSRFQKKTEAPSSFSNAKTSSPSVSPPSVAPVQFEETGDLPGSRKLKEEKTDLWSLDQGGVCPSCQTFNLAGVVFCGSCSYMLLRTEEEVVVITSYPLKEIKGLAHTFVNKLAELNIHSTEDVLRVGSNRKNRDMISKRTGLSERSILRLVHTSDICRVPSMGPENAAMLELLAITTLADMLKQKPLELHAKIHQNRIKINQQGILFMPTKNQVSQWFEDAQALPAIRIN
ncbi:MAG: DUF4332 domain-containing protein [Candidatus Sericytochromatia bacterium]|nr:DUF4332 domain-containing protein [Candidatus Sericytochromatia bacterium]